MATLVDANQAAITFNLASYDSSTIGDPRVVGFIFTASETYVITQIELRLARGTQYGFLPGNVRASIYAAPSDEPTGGVIDSAEVVAQTIPQTPTSSYTTFAMTGGATLSSGTKYAVVINGLESNPTSTNYILVIGSDDAIAGGYVFSTDGEVTWDNTTFFTYDANFRTYKAGVPPTKAESPSPSDTAEDDGCFDYRLSWSDGGGADTYNVYIGSESGSLNQVTTGVSNLFYVVDSEDFPTDSVVYWRIDSVNGDGTTTGDEWWFDPQPDAATGPNPIDGAGNVSPGQSRLYWDGEGLYQTFDVYIDSVLVEEGATNEYFDLDDLADWPLEENQRYDWHVISHNLHTVTGVDSAAWYLVTGMKRMASRPSFYDPDLVWDISTSSWVSISAITVTGGGRYQSQIIVLGHNVIYFGDV